MTRNRRHHIHFTYGIQISQATWSRFDLQQSRLELLRLGAPPLLFFRELALRLNSSAKAGKLPVRPGQLRLYALLSEIFRYLVAEYFDKKNPGLLDRLLGESGLNWAEGALAQTVTGFAEFFPAESMLDRNESATAYLAGDSPEQQRKETILRECLLLKLAAENPALDPFRDILDDVPLARQTPYASVVTTLDKELAKAPPFPPFNLTLMEFLRAPIKASPASLTGQLEFIRSHWQALLPAELLAEMLTAFDIVREEERQWWGTPGPPQVLEFSPLSPRSGSDYPEYERFSPDADWMPNLVLIAKMVYVWLGQLTNSYGFPISRLDQIPDAELDRLARWGFSGLWLIGIWERSPASATIKHITGNPEAVASAYSLYDYVIAADLGGEEALQNLKERARQRGIRLACDMVPNHTGIYSRWTREHPEWFVQLDYPPFPSYSFTGHDLASSPDISLFIEDGYWDRRDAAVVFKHVNNYSGQVRYIYHGNDGTSTPWNDTAQLNYLIPEVRETVIQTILHVARQFPIIRFDAAMTLAKKHYQRLWFPQPGLGGAIPSRAEQSISRDHFDAVFPHEFWREVVDRVAAEVPDTLLLAEAFWLMEGYFVRTLGMHRVYNSAFMNMLKMEENAKYRKTIMNVLEFNPEILKRFVNFMNNPDERTAVEQFGKEGKYFGATVLLVTMPGLPMIGHGQIEGFHEKYGMEYRRACWDEPVDEHLVTLHEARIFPLMRRRFLFSGADHFAFYDFLTADGLDENVFAYSNRSGGERGLIFYNNRFGSTAGRIMISTPIAVKTGGEETTLIRKNLAEALAINSDGRYYYRFRDYATGLEYVRHGTDLLKNGMFVELHAYDYHAFLDFVELYEDDYGTWGEVCRRLNGKPAVNLDEEVKQVRYHDMLSAFRTLFSHVLGLFTPAGPKATPSPELPVMPFLAALSSHVGNTNDLQEMAAVFANDYRHAATTFARLGTTGKLAVQETEIGRENDPVIVFALAACAVLHRIGALHGEDGIAGRSADWLENFGLTWALSGIWQESLHAGVPPGTDVGDVGRFVTLLVRYHEILREGDNGELANTFMRFFTDPEAKNLMLCNWSGGKFWFNRERFLVLIKGVELVAAVFQEDEARKGKAAERGRTSTPKATLVQAVAEAAHYSVEDFIRELATGPEPVPKWTD